MLVSHLAYETQEISEGEQTKTFRSWWRYTRISVTFLGLWWTKRVTWCWQPCSCITVDIAKFKTYLSSVCWKHNQAGESRNAETCCKQCPWNCYTGYFMSNHVCMSLCSCQIVNAEHFAQTSGSYWIWSYCNSIWTNRAIALKAPAHHFKYSWNCCASPPRNMKKWYIKWVTI